MLWRGLTLVLIGQNTLLGVAQHPIVGRGSNDELQDEECWRQRAKRMVENTSDLFDSWMDGYDRFKRPNLAIQSDEEQRAGNATADTVRAGLYINQLWGFNELDGTFMIQAYLTLGWRDPRLCFDDTRLPAAGKGGSKDDKSVELDLNNRVDLSSGVDRLHQLWIPDINLENSLRLAGNVDPDADLFKAFSNGTIEWSRRFVVTLSADLKFENLPFDTQYLYVNLESYRMSADDLVLQWDLESFPHGLDAEFNNPEWEFYTQASTEHGSSSSAKLASYCGWPSTPAYKPAEPIRSHCDRRCAKLCDANTRQYAGDTAKFSRVRFSMVLKRQTHSWVFGAIVPSVILCLISYMGLYIARDNPGRPGVHCVTILAHFTLDASMRREIPHVGKNMWIDQFQTIMLFSHLVLFLEYTIVHYSARQKYREQVITDAQLRKLMAYDEVAADILGNPQLAAACGHAINHSRPTRQSSAPSSPNGTASLAGRLTAVDDAGGGTTMLASLSPQELEDALVSMAPDARRIVQHKLRTARARLGGSVSEWGEVPEDFYSNTGRRRWGKSPRAAASSSREQDKQGMFGFGSRETISAAAMLSLNARADSTADRDEGIDVDASDGDGEVGGTDSHLNVTPVRDLPGTPDKSLQSRRRLRQRDRSTTDHAIVGALTEPLFNNGSGHDGLEAGQPRLPGHEGSSTIEELELGSPDDDRAVREQEWCGARMRVRTRHFCNRVVDWYNDMMTLILANASNLDRPCRMLFPIVYSLALSSILLQAGTDVTELINAHVLAV